MGLTAFRKSRRQAAARVAASAQAPEPAQAAQAPEPKLEAAAVVEPPAMAQRRGRPPKSG